MAIGQVYQEMPQYGYRANRMAFDSALQMPTICGTPTLKSNITNRGAIAFDSCNNRFYYYNPKPKTWTALTGGTSNKVDSVNISNDSLRYWINGVGYFITKITTTQIDTTSLSNRINSKLAIVDTANRWVNSVTKLNDSTIRVVKNTTTTDLVILGKQIDTTSLSNRINTKINIADSSAMLLPYLRKVDTTNKFVVNLAKLNDSTFRFFKGSTSTDITLPRTSIVTDTSNAFVNNIVKVTDSSFRFFKGTTNTLLTFARIDTANRFVLNVTRLNDSVIQVSKGGTITNLLIKGVPDNVIGSNGLNGTNNIKLGGDLVNGTTSIEATSDALSSLQIGNTRKMDNLIMKANQTTISSSNDLFLIQPTTSQDTTTYKPLAVGSNGKVVKGSWIGNATTIDTTNKFVNNVTKKNDSTIIVFKGSGATEILLPRGSGGTTIDTTNRFVNNVTKKNDSTITIFKGSGSTDIEILGNLNGSGTTNYLPIWTNTNKLGTSTINDSANNIWFKRNGQNRSWINPSGFQFWQLNDGVSESGLIGYGTPNSKVGISMFNSSLTGRSDIRHQTNGGFSFATHSAGTIPLVDQVFINPTGNLQIGQGVDSGYKLLVVGDAKITDSVKFTGIQNMTDTTSAKPLVIDANGQVKKALNWGAYPTLDQVLTSGNLANNFIDLRDELNSGSLFLRPTEWSTFVYKPFDFNNSLGGAVLSVNGDEEFSKLDLNYTPNSSNVVISTDVSTHYNGTITDTFAYKSDIRSYVTDYARPYKSYVAIISDSAQGGNPTTNFVFENNIGGITWTHLTAGTYNAFCDGCFPQDKTFLPAINFGNDVISAEHYGNTKWLDSSNIRLVILRDGGTRINGFSRLMIEIRKYN
jgi:hypothetical protein